MGVLTGNHPRSSILSRPSVVGGWFWFSLVMEEGIDNYNGEGEDALVAGRGTGVVW